MSLSSKEWRLNNLYRIVDKDGNSIPFRLNAVQQNALSIAHKRKLFLKARQLGMSTFAVIDALDDVIFSENLSAGIVSYSIEHAQHIFKKIIGHALDTFPDKLKPFLGITARSAREITFSNGSSLRVDTTLRGGSYQNVLVSEFGKTCARYPQKAEEIVTGTLQAIGSSGKVTIESTGEGSDGYFAEMVIAADQHKNESLTDLDYWLCFYPWYCDTSYKIDASAVKIDAQLAEYFRKIESEQSITLTQEQKVWYAVQARTLGDKIKQEYPSTISEAFLSKSDAYYFAESIKKAWDERRCLYTPLYDALQPVYVAIDIGLNDLTVVIFFQLCHGEIRIIDYYEDSNKDVPFYAHFLQNDKKYLYHTIFLPHEIGRASC